MSTKEQKKDVRRRHVENANISVASLWNNYTLRGMYRPPATKQSVGCPDAALTVLRKYQAKGKASWLGWQQSAGWFVLACEDARTQRVSVAYMENASCAEKMPKM